MRLIDTVKDYLPVFSVILIFVGFVNRYSFYFWFDVKIENYLTTTELIFSFLPLILPFLLAFMTLLFISYALHLVVARQEKKELKIGYINDGTYSIPVAWKRLKENFSNAKTILDWIFIPFSIVIFVLSILIQAFSIFFIFIVIDAIFSKEPTFHFGHTLIFGIIWVIILYSRIAIYKKKKTKKRVRIVAHIITAILFIGEIWLYNSERAEKILSGKPEFIVEIELEKDTIVTDTINVYVGETTGYLFMRDISRDKTTILPKSLIRNQTINRSKYNKRFTRPEN